MHKVLDAREKWAASVRWLDAHTDQSARREEMNKCRSHLDTLGWNVPMMNLGGYGTTVAFASILADSMVEGYLLDVMVLDLAQRIEADQQLSGGFGVASLTFLDMLGKAYKEWDRPGFQYPVYLERLEQKLKGRKKIFLFPGHLPDKKHYIGLRVDF